MMELRRVEMRGCQAIRNIALVCLSPLLADMQTRAIEQCAVERQAAASESKGTPPGARNPIDGIPFVVFSRVVCSFLDARDLARADSVVKSWRGIEDSNWKAAFDRDWGRSCSDRPSVAPSPLASF